MTIASQLNPRAMLAELENASPEEKQCVDEMIGAMVFYYLRDGNP